jgi:hypothetical protein
VRGVAGGGCGVAERGGAAADGLQLCARSSTSRSILQMFRPGAGRYDTRRGRCAIGGLTCSDAKLPSLAPVFGRTGIQPHATAGAAVCSVRDESTRGARFRLPSLPIRKNRRRIPLLARLVCLCCNLIRLQLLSASLSNLVAVNYYMYILFRACQYHFFSGFVLALTTPLVS